MIRIDKKLILIVLFLLLDMIFIISHKSKKNSNKNKSSSILKLLNLYSKLEKLKFFRREFNSIRARLFLYAEKEDEIAYNIIKIYIFKSIALLIVFGILSKLLAQDIWTLGLNIIICYILNDSIISYLVVSELDIYNKIILFTDTIKHAFHINKDIEKSITEAANVVGIQIEGKKMAKAIANKTELNKYLNNCPNKFLKVIVSISYLTREYGDKKVKDVSLYIKNLSYIKDEVKLERDIKEKLNYWIKTLCVACLIPIIFPSPVLNWMKTTIEQTKNYIDGSGIYISKFILIVLVIVCYTLTKKLKTIQDKKFSINFDCLEQKILSSKAGKKIFKFLIPKETNFLYKRREKLLKESFANITVEWLYVRRYLLFVIALTFSIGLFFSADKLNRNLVLSNNLYGLDIKEYTQLQQFEDQQGIKSNDKEILLTLKQTVIDLKIEEISNKIESDLISKNYKGEILKLKQKQLLNKYIGLNKKQSLDLKWMIIFLLIPLLVSYIPILNVIFEKTLLEAAMQNEVAQFNTIILLLMHHQEVSNEVLLKWMLDFSHIFYEPIKKCLNSYKRNSDEALEELKRSTNYIPFRNIVDNLAVFKNDLTLVEAFESLESDREFYKLDRIEENERMLNKRYQKAKFVSFIPIAAFIVLFFIMPMFVTAYQEFQRVSVLIGS